MIHYESKESRTNSVQDQMACKYVILHNIKFRPNLGLIGYKGFLSQQGNIWKSLRSKWFFFDLFSRELSGNGSKIAK